MPKEKTNRIWDFLVIWPFIYFFLLAILVPVIATSLDYGDASKIVGGAIAFGLLFMIVYFATIISMVVVYIYAIHRLYTHTNLSDDQKRTWLILVVIFSIFAIPFLHFKHLRK